MGSIPYVTSTGKIQPFFTKVQEVGKPESVDKKWLESIGFKGSNDSRLLGLLRGDRFRRSSRQANRTVAGVS